jgi:hypothetical protein
VANTITPKACVWLSLKVMEAESGISAGTFAFMLFQETLAQANTLGRDFNQLVIINELDAIFQS